MYHALRQPSAFLEEQVFTHLPWKDVCWLTFVQSSLDQYKLILGLCRLGNTWEVSRPCPRSCLTIAGLCPGCSRSQLDFCQLWASVCALRLHRMVQVKRLFTAHHTH